MSVLQRYVVDGSVVDGIMTQKFVDIDGFCSQNKCVSVLGGVLGQLMLVLNALYSYT